MTGQGSMMDLLFAMLSRRVFPVCREWDRILSTALDEGTVRFEISPLLDVSAYVGDCEIWLRNWPYAYGHPYRPRANVLPSWRTARQLRREHDAFVAGHNRRVLDRALDAARRDTREVAR